MTDQTRPILSLRHVVLAISITLSFMAIFFAVTLTATHDPTIRPYIIAIALGLAAILLLLGIIDVTRASNGLLQAVIFLLPKVHAWGVRTKVRALCFSATLLAAGAASIWIGPNGIVSQTVNCDEAAEIEFSIRSGRHKCEGAFARKIWIPPFDRNARIELSCFDHRSNQWAGSYVTGSTSHCGSRPQDARFVTNGIGIPDHDSATVGGRRLVEGLSRLRAALSDGRLPDRKVKDRLLFATWNLRDFGKQGFAWQASYTGARLDESFAFIAEVISYFDIVAIQEVRDRAALSKLMNLLGKDYKSEFGFISPGLAGNRERLGFIYDSRKVSLGAISTAIVFGPSKRGSSDTRQPARPPFLVEFAVNGRNFFAVTAHIYWGSDSGPLFEKRLFELEQISSGLDKTFERNFPEHPVIFAGDLSISSSDGPEMKTLFENGFETTEELGAASTNHRLNRPYDQIMVRSKPLGKMTIGQAGVFNPFDYVFMQSEQQSYRIDVQRSFGKVRFSDSDEEQRFLQFRIRQISDHLLKWAEFRIDW